MTRTRYHNPLLDKKIHHLDPHQDVRDRKCDIAANQYLRDQLRGKRKPRRRRKPIIRRGLAAMAYDTYQGELPPPVLIPRSRN
jgi:hypothetical protein